MVVRWLRLGIKNGEAESEMLLAWMLVLGDGIEPRTEEGLKLMEKAAAKGLTQAQVNLGRIYEGDLDTEVPPDIKKAESWYRKAMASGDADGACRLGHLAFRGKIQATREQTVQWLQTAVDAGHTHAVSTLNEARARK